MEKKKRRITDIEVTATTADFTDSNFMLMDGGEGSKKVPMDLFTGQSHEYAAGNGIDITNDEISVDTDVVATKTDLASKQDLLTVVIPNESVFSDIDDDNVVLKDGETIYQLAFKSDERAEFTNVDNEHLNTWTIDNESTWTFETKELSGQTLSAESPIKIEDDVIKAETMELTPVNPLEMDNNGNLSINITALKSLLGI